MIISQLTFTSFQHKFLVYKTKHFLLFESVLFKIQLTMNKLIFITVLKIVYIRSDNDEEVENVVET